MKTIDEKRKRARKATARWRKRNPDYYKEYAARPSVRKMMREVHKRYRARKIARCPTFYTDRSYAWRKANPEGWRAIARRAKQKRYNSDIQFRLGQCYSSCVYKALKKHLSDGSHRRTSVPIGCTIAAYKRFIEARMLPGMSWANWSRAGWHIDHRIPKTAFDLTKSSHVKRCFHYKNTQPLWYLDNYRKGGAR